TEALYLPVFGLEDDGIQEDVRTFNFDPSLIENKDNRPGSLARRSLLRTVDSFTYTGREFEYRRIPVEVEWEYLVGDETFSYVVTLYPSGHLSAPVTQPNPQGYPEDERSEIPDYRNRTDHRWHYPDVPKDAP
ncbi:hypothetical protein H0H93_004855, partial [Arthromyces matolae]